MNRRRALQFAGNKPCLFASCKEENSCPHQAGTHFQCFKLACVVLHSDWYMGHESIASKYRTVSKSRHCRWGRVYTGLAVTRRRLAAVRVTVLVRNDHDSFELASGLTVFALHARSCPFAWGGTRKIFSGLTTQGKANSPLTHFERSGDSSLWFVATPMVHWRVSTIRKENSYDSTAS
jgi:hypothetical protein